MQANEHLSPWATERHTALIRVIALLGPWWHHTMSPSDATEIYDAAQISTSAAMDALVRAGYILVQGKAMPINEVMK